MRHGRLPPANNIDAIGLAPMLALKIKRYIMLKTELYGTEEVKKGEREILDFQLKTRR